MMIDSRIHELTRAIEEEVNEDTVDLIADRLSDVLDEIGFYNRVELEWDQAVADGLIDDIEEEDLIDKPDPEELFDHEHYIR